MPHNSKPVLNLITFAWKYCAPAEVDYIVDARILPDPHKNQKFRGVLGTDENLAAWLLYGVRAPELLSLITAVRDELPAIQPSTVGIGSIRGKQRSVFLAEHIKKQNLYQVVVVHRDIDR